MNIRNEHVINYYYCKTVQGRARLHMLVVIYDSEATSSSSHGEQCGPRPTL